MALLLSVAGCDGDKEAKKSATPEKSAKADDKAKSGDAAKAEDKAPEPEKAAEAPLTLVSQDITAKVSSFFPGFEGTKIEMKLPEGVTFSQKPGGFTVATDEKVFAVEVATIFETAEVIKKIEAGDSLLDGAKITEKGDGYVIQHGKYFGGEGHSLNFDLEPIGALKSGCRTPTGRLYSDSQIRTILEACQSIKVTK
ncbi:MAG: hypothetical protein AAF799_06285 [Myxococcota bacterium]